MATWITLRRKVHLPIGAARQPDFVGTRSHQMLMDKAEEPQWGVTQRLQGVARLARKRIWFLLFVLLPIATATIYYGLIASDIYVSESRFVIKSPGQRQVQSSALANLFQSTGLTTGQEQSKEVVDYLRSRDALNQLQKGIDVRRAFSAAGVDAFSRFPAPFRDPTFENFYRFFGRMVSVGVDTESSGVVLEVRAFTARDAQQINARLLDQSESLVNRLNDRAQRKAIEENLRQVREAELRLQTARVAIREYRNKHELLDPVAQGAGVLEVSNALIAQEAGLKAQLQQLERAAPGNPSIPALRARIAAISAQVAAQTGRAVGTSTGIASKLTEYERLLAEQQFATQMLTVANSALEQSRAEAQKQQFYLERIVEPSLPDMPMLPSRIREILTIAGISVCLYMIGWMLIVGILEHAPED